MNRELVKFAVVWNFKLKTFKEKIEIYLIIKVAQMNILAVEIDFNIFSILSCALFHPLVHALHTICEKFLTNKIKY